jgi:DNA-binding HxlR family transcriptional regulator
LNKLAGEDYKQEVTEFTEGIDRYKSLLLRLAEDEKMDVVVSVEGTEQHDLNIERDLDVLEKALLVKRKMKYTHRNAYREYELTPKGNELVKKMLKVT